MAEEFVRKEHFEEFSRRMDERFLGVEKQMEQGFAHAAKEREQNFVHLNQVMEQGFAHAEKEREQNFAHLKEFMKQGFDNMERRFDDQRKVVLIMLTALVGATVVSVVGAAVKYVFFSS